MTAEIARIVVRAEMDIELVRTIMAEDSAARADNPASAACALRPAREAAPPLV